MENPVFDRWPNNSKLALQIVLKYEEGGENCVFMETNILKHFYQKLLEHNHIKDRHINMESLYEYGSRRGFWRLHKLFMERKYLFTIFGVATALEKNKDVCEAIKKSFSGN